MHVHLGVEHPLGQAPAISAEALDELPEGEDPATILQSNGLRDELKKAAIQQN